MFGHADRAFPRAPSCPARPSICSGPDADGVRRRAWAAAFRPADEVHLGRTDEARDEDVARAHGTAPAASPPVRSRPACSTTILSAMVIASTWSWVT